MKKNRILLACALCAFLSPVSAQKNDRGEGKVILTTFANFYTGFGAENDKRGFELERAYLGYQYKWNNGLSLQAVADFGKSKKVDDMQRIGYIKNAWARYQKKGWDLYGGLISTTQFKVQEDFWGKRYVMKSLQDDNGFGSSADLGVSVAYKFCKQAALDVIVVNGEGYKKLQWNNGLQYGAGLTLKPVDGMTVRLYGSYDEASDRGEKGKVNLASFVGYAHKYFRVGAEYNYQMHTGYEENANLNGVSAYAVVPAGKVVDVFARWDRVDSNNGWNMEKDGMKVVAGAEVKLGSKVLLAPNFRVDLPEDNSRKEAFQFLVNASFKL